MEYSTIGPLGTVIAQAIESYGVDPTGLFEDLGLDVVNLRDPNVRIPSAVLLRLVEKSVLLSKDPLFGLKLAQFIHPTTFYSLGIALYSSDNLRDFLARYVKYYRLITSNDSIDAMETSAGYQLVAVPKAGVKLVPERIDGYAAITTQVIRNASSEEFAPLSVALARPHPGKMAEHYAAFFACPVEFDAEQTSISISSEVLDQTLPTANPELIRLYEDITEKYLAKIDKADFPERVQQQLVKLLPMGISGKEQVAAGLHISTRTLYNKLEAAGTSYRQVLDQTRCEMAKDYLLQNMPIHEIAYLIGFSDTANFSRAFKKWVGQPPLEYRDSLPVEAP